MTISKTTGLICATSLLFVTACGGGTAVKDAPEAKAVSQPVKTKLRLEQTATPSLNEVQLKTLLIGRTQKGQKDKKWTNTYNPNGVLAGAWGSESQTGKYTIKGNLLCRQWKTWAKGTMSCWTIQKREKDYYATLKSGSSESYAFTMGAKAEQKQEQTALTDAQIKSVLIGKTIVGDQWTDKVNGDGTFDSIYKGKASKGKYSIVNGLYCTGTNTDRCRSITKTATGYYAKSVSGGGDSYSFTVR